MPEKPADKQHPHPYRLAMMGQDARAGVPPAGGGPSPVRYVELAVTSNFTFLTGASHPDEFIAQAALDGHAACAIADTNTLAGIVRAHSAGKEHNLPVVIGCRLAFIEPAGLTVLVYPTSRPAYSRLCGLLTLGKRLAPKGECYLNLSDLPGHAPGMLAVVIPPGTPDGSFLAALAALRGIFDDDRLSLALCARYRQDDAAVMRRNAALADEHRIPIVAINDAHYHHPDRRQLQDVLTCIRHGCTIEQAGLRLHPNAERHLKPPDEMARLFAGYPEAIARTWEIARRALQFNLDQIRYEYPTEPCPEGMTPFDYLVDRTHAGAARRYPAGTPEKVRHALEHELAMIKELHYEPYFLTCYDIVEYARSLGILCQGRGGAANSAVCYCLGITEVDPARFSLLFERFISRARNEPPDIDIDFEHERREEVIQYIYRKYGRDRAALTAEVISYRGRSSVRDVGKAMGLSLDCVDVLARHMGHWGESPTADRVREAGLNPEDPTIALVIDLSGQLAGFPRHLSQHVGGFVITRTPLSELVPIENAAMEDRTVIEWDKDDIDAMGMLKIDVLGLGMLTCIRKAFELVATATGEQLSIPRIMGEFAQDTQVYAMIQRADTVGVFQIESRAQMSMLPRLRPACFYDLVIEVAIVRPGPIQGKMVHPYLKRRSGEEPVHYPSPQVRAVLERTLGVPIFQEQAMQLAIVAAGFSADEADNLRRAMAAWRRKGDRLAAFEGRFIGGMLSRGYALEFAQRCFGQLRGFSEYGFPESHAASFAILVYVSCWLKHHRPAAFAAALINSQPMGFYQPAQIVRDAREHGVVVRPVDVNLSAWDCTLEQAGRDPSTHRFAVRLGQRLVKGLPERDAAAIAGAVAGRGRFKDVPSLWRTTLVPAASLRKLAAADAFGSMNLDRRAALWQIQPLRDEELPLFDAPRTRDREQDFFAEDDPNPALPVMHPRLRMLQDYQATGLSLASHPLTFLRPQLARRRVIRNAELREPGRCPQGRTVSVAGVVLVRQRPGTASGVVFITLEDESSIANLILWPGTFEKYRKVARTSAMLLARGHVERQGEVVHVHVDHLECIDGLLDDMPVMSRDFH